MKNLIFTKFFLLSSLLLLLTLAPICFAQNSPATASPTPQNTEIMGEDDRLPFMQTEESSSAAQEPGSGGLLLKTLGAMLLIVGLIFGGAWGAKKLGFGNFNSKNLADDVNLKILTSVSLGSGRTISTVRFGERVLLVGSTAQTFTLLAEEKAEPKTSQFQTRSVAEMLGDEIIPFDVEFEKAQARLENETGGQI